MEIEIDSTIITPVGTMDIEVPSVIEVTPSEVVALDITFDNNEYSIVGDDMVVLTKYEDAPQWLKDTIDNIVTIQTAVAVGDLDQVKQSLDVMLGELDVAKNTYQMSIISSDDIDSRIHTAITTLNSSLQEADATILQIAQTATTPEEASAIALNVLSASLSSSGEIGSAIYNLQTAMATLDSTTAESISYLNSVMEGEIQGNASAMHTIRTYVGLDDNGVANDTGLLADVAILQKQNDGIIETITGTYDVMLNPQDPNLAELVTTAEPYASWKLEDGTGITVRLNHIGDVYIKYSITSNGGRQYIGSYKFIRAVVDNSDAHKSTDADGFTWALITDQAAQDAYNQALNAYDLADDKRRVFVNTPATPYDIGDLWVRVVSGSNQIWRSTIARSTGGFVSNDWSLASTDDTATVALQTGLANGTTTIKLTNAYVGTTPLTDYLTSEIDGKIGVYSGTVEPVAGQPSGVSTNDLYLWFTTQIASGKTYDITRTYKYSGTIWNEITTNDDITNLADLADGKRTIFSGSTVPVGAVDRDIWIPSVTNGSYVKGEIYQYVGGTWNATTRYTADIEALTNNVQTQIDGKVDTYYQDALPFANATNVSKKVQSGDYWYCTLTADSYVKGKMYKYAESANGSNYNYTWTETADVSKYAFDLADGKASIFSTSVTPSSYKVNDLMVVVGSDFSNGSTTFTPGVVLTATVGRTSGFIAADWVKRINDTEALNSFVNVTYTPMVTSLQNQIDGKVESWFTVSTSDPKTAWTDTATRNKHDGDMWYQTDLKKSYYYSSSTNTWNLIDDAKAIQALSDAATAQASADGKITSYYIDTFANAQVMSNAWTTLEKANNVGDLVIVWNDTTLDNNGTWRWNGTSWVNTRDKKLISLASDVTTLRTDLNSGTGTWASADATVSSTLNTTIANGLANVESKWAYNSTVNINGIYKKSGFGLTTNYTSGSGTEVDPYVSEFWIDASRMKFTNSNVTGSVAPFTIDATGVTPQITFNGVVNFSNVTGTPDYVLPAEVANAVNNNITTIDGSKITTGSISATQISAASVTADRLSASTNGSTVWSGGGLVSQNFDGNAAGDIGSPTAGFRLSSNAAGTSADPNIYGAYIKGATLEGSALNINDVKVIAEDYLDNFGPLYTTKTVTDANNGGPYTGVPYEAITPVVTFYGRGYSSGYRGDRACAVQQKMIIKAASSGFLYFSDGTPGRTTIEVEYRYGSGSWVTLGKVTTPTAGRAVKYINQTFNIPATSYIQFRATGTNLGAIYTDMDVTLVNSNA